jgi:hypothetical protein
MSAGGLLVLGVVVFGLLLVGLVLTVMEFKKMK